MQFMTGMTFFTVAELPLLHSIYVQILRVNLLITNAFRRVPVGLSSFQSHKKI